MAGPSNRAKTGLEARHIVMRFLQEDRGIDPGETASHAKMAARLVRALEDAHYVIAPRKYEKPARRGNSAPKDPWIGKSHSARLIDGART